MTSIRLFRPGDEAALGEVCVRTADEGGDATGMLGDDELWPAIFVWPYVARHPETALVVEDDAGNVAGYAVAAPDTDAFGHWFATSWWPGHATRWPLSANGDAREDGLLGYAAALGTQPSHFQELGYPAHLHIDLLPVLQGRGQGRLLIAALADLLRAAGVPGVHLSAAAGNAGALAFYPRVGFHPLPSEGSGVSFGMLLDPVSG